MGIDCHTIDQVSGSTFAFTDRVLLLNLPQQANAAGGGAGSSVTTAVSVPSGVTLPAAYSVLVGGLSQDATAYVTGRTSTGFNVVLEPRLAANTLAAGTFDVVVIA
jgi:hypothetical protein